MPSGSRVSCRSRSAATMSKWGPWPSAPADPDIGIWTWRVRGRILLAHTTEFDPDTTLYERGIDWAPYVSEGEFLAFSNMPAGSVLNWIRSLAFQRANWETVAREAEEAGVGAGGVRFFPSLIEGMGPYGLQNLPGSIIGIQTLTKRGALVRAAIEALCIQVRLQLKLLEEMTGEPCEVLRVVGGGHKNDLWLQTKANVLGRPVEIVDTSEATLLGAALLGGVGAGFYPSIAEAQDAVRLNIHTIEPEMDRHEDYLSVVESYGKIPIGAGTAVPALTRRLYSPSQTEDDHRHLGG